nr:hypothetical protein [Tanacetum cinerariifolium]
TIDTTIDQQAAMDEALVPYAQRLRIGRSKFRLLSDIKSKESTLQLVYDVMRICPFFKAFLITVDIVNLESFRDMQHICLRVHGQSFNEPPFKEEILSFIRFLGHSAAIRMHTDVNINKLYQPWRSFAAIINKCLIGKSSGYDSLRLSQAQILDDHMFSIIKLVCRHQNTQQFGALLPIELTNEEIRNSNAYKEYYAITTGAASPEPKASVRRTRSSSDTSITPPTASARDGDDDEDGDGEEGNDDDDQEVERDDDKDDEEEGNGDEDLGLNVGGEEGHVEEEEEDELYIDANISQGRGIQATLEVKDSHVTLTPVNPDGQQQSSLVSSQFMTSMLNPTHDVCMESIFEITSKWIL